MYFPEDEDYIQYRKEMHDDIALAMGNGELPNDIVLQDLVYEGYPTYKNLFITLPGQQETEICFMMQKRSSKVIVAEAMIILDKEPITQTLTTVYDNKTACDLIVNWACRARQNKFYRKK